MPDSVFPQAMKAQQRAGLITHNTLTVFPQTAEGPNLAYRPAKANLACRNDTRSHLTVFLQAMKANSVRTGLITHNTLTVFPQAMKANNVYQMVFSSSCTVYGDPEHLPITEDHPTGAVTNVYGRTKYLIEEMLKDLSRAEQPLNLGLGQGISVLEFIKEFERITKTRIPFEYSGRRVGDVATLVCDGRRGTAQLGWKPTRSFETYNLGTGQGVSVLQLVKAFEAVTESKVPYELKPRREGDIVSMFANTTLATIELGWTAKYSLENMCEDFWRWQTMNPDGYAKDEPFEATVLDRSQTVTTPPGNVKTTAATSTNSSSSSVNGVNGVKNH
ncbi:UDP-glucose 4-epimerase-like 3 [Homarus americanus]|uniref:UDP-glucose 4-epimerase-like 3 n=1 Tax=Homarus americanus TaxID=6706 RepID=A0A8J5NAJ9_HOMAM|nr:UDP-glucose 4-epimerase-like 3 [Homarus americanus]